MGNIIGEVFLPKVRGQINIRQQKLGSFKRSDQVLRWMNSKTAYLRLCSAVDLNTGDETLAWGSTVGAAAQRILDILGAPNLGGSKLAQKLVLVWTL